MYSNIPLLRIILPQLLFRRPGMWAESAKTLSLQKGKEKNMEEILKIDTVDQYNKLFGFETRHPQVGVVSFDTAESQGNYRMTMGFYSVFLKETAGCRINYGKTSYDLTTRRSSASLRGRRWGIPTWRVFPRNRSGCCFIPILSAVRRWGRRLRNIRFFL